MLIHSDLSGSWSNDDLLLWHKLWLQSHQVLGHIHPQVPQLSEELRILLIFSFLHVNTDLNLGEWL